jgi:hypothetical protein
MVRVCFYIIDFIEFLLFLIDFCANEKGHV